MTEAPRLGSAIGDPIDSGLFPDDIAPCDSAISTGKVLAIVTALFVVGALVAGELINAAAKGCRYCGHEAPGA